jgi:hypothetical protein
VIFISHANPEENDFVLWLAGRLSSTGYEVWSDLTKLIGGEIFWDRIDAAIRNEAVVFLSVVSRRSIKKRNFLNELSIASSVEAARGTDDFVIPLRIDDLAFGDVPPQIHRKNIIDFSGTWHAGLLTLIRKLEQLTVPRAATSNEQLRNWARNHFGFAQGVESRPETVASNWLELQDLPPSIFVMKMPPGVETPALFEPHVWPLVKFRDCVASFCHPSELGLESLRSIKPSEVSVDAVLGGEASFLRGAIPTAGESVMSHLIRRVCERYARQAGLSAYRLAGRRNAWFLPLSGSEIPWIDYQGMSGVRRRKRLIGRSEKRGVYWHAALEFTPMVRRAIRLGLLMHVVFTTDGLNPLGEAATMHRLRRRFCKNWWQDQWRDLQLAYLSFLSKDTKAIAMAVAPQRSLSCSSDPIKFEVPVSYIQVQPSLQTAQGADELADASDDYEDDDPLVEIAELEKGSS